MLDFSTSNYPELDLLPKAPSPRMTDRYMFIDTKRVAQDMADLGFHIAGFRRPRYRTNEGAFGLHEVDFRRPEHMKADVSEAPRIVFLNTYDGSRKATFVSGIIRFICGNGLIAGEHISKMKIMHLQSYEDDLVQGIKDLQGRYSQIFDRIETYRTITLDRSQYYTLAERASEARFGDEGIKVDPQILLMPRRSEDNKRDLWTTWNRLQENLMRGGLPAKNAKGDDVITRPLNQIWRSTTLNAELWSMMDEAAKQVA